MPRRTVAIPIFASLAVSCLLVFVVARAQDLPGGPETNTSTTDPFNACLLGTCEPQRVECVASAGGDAALLGRCEAYLSACLDACRAGGTDYAFPPLPPPEPAIELEPVPAALLEPLAPPETETPPPPEPVSEPEPEPDAVPAPREEEPRPAVERLEPAAVPEDAGNETEAPADDEGFSEEERKATDDLVEAQILEGDVRPILGFTSISEEGAEEAEWVASQEEPGQDVSSYVMLIGDMDGDGLPDAIEGDIPEDDPTAEALSSGAPLGQPEGAGEEDSEFTVEEGEPEEGSHLLRGHCDPDAICLIYIYSYIPVVLAVKTDTSGNYVYDISDYIGSGSHVAYVTVTDKTGKIAKKSSPFSFVIPEALAAEEPEALPALNVDVEKAAPNYLIYYVLGATGLVLVGVGLALSLRKKTP